MPYCLLRPGRSTAIALALSLLSSTSPAIAQRAATPALTRQIADSLLAAKDYRAALDAYQTLARRDTGNAALWFGVGMAAANLKQYEQGVAAFSRIATAPGYAPVASYNTGAMYARLGRPDSAFRFLQQATAFGFSDENTLRTDDDLASVRSDPRFASVLYNATHVPTPCATDADHRRFDFWIGEWNVTTPAGQPAGSSVVQVVSGGCALLENWTSTRGITGKSLNTYNPAQKAWQQFWVGQGGGVTEFRESEWKDGALSYIARSPGRLTRLTFAPLDSNTVRQYGELSTDDGRTWAMTFDLHYHRKR